MAPSRTFTLKNKNKFLSQNIYIPFQNFQSVGGPSTFMRNLQTYLDQTSYSYVSNLEAADNIFFPVAYAVQELKEIKKRKGKVIQRLDGIYYPSKHGKKYRQLNAPIKKVYRNLADFVIFQSEYSKKQCFKILGMLPEERYKIIVNGVNQSIFYPNSDLPTPNGKFKLVTTGNFRNIDMIEPVVQALDQLPVNFELTIIGPITNDSLKPFFNRPYINRLGSLPAREIAAVLRQQHIFVYSHLNPPCPNSVLEAVSTGLPIVGFASGAMEELLYFSKKLLASVSDEIFQEYCNFDVQLLQQKIQLAMHDYRKWREIALAYSHLYSFETCGKAYTDTFQAIDSLPSRPSRPIFRRFFTGIFAKT